MNNLIRFDENEQSAYREFRKIEGIAKLRKSAGKTIANFLIFNHYLKKKQRLIDHTKTIVYINEYSQKEKE